MFNCMMRVDWRFHAFDQATMSGEEEDIKLPFSGIWRDFEALLYRQRVSCVS